MKTGEMKVGATHFPKCVAPGDARYPAYKDSGVEWLGEIPAHWEMLPLKYVVKQIPDAIKTGPFGSQLLSSEMESGEIKVYNQRNVIDADLLQGDNYISQEKYGELRAFTVYPGDILVTTRGTIGRCVIVPDDAELGILHPCLMRIQPDQAQILAKYLILLIQDSLLVQTQLFEMSNATTIEVIYSGTMRQVRIPLPPLPEQRAIAAYLDRETARLDDAIAEARRFIGLLHERRAALIAEAVTKGLDPNAPRKDSGIEWLGEIPNHWHSAALKHWVDTKITDGPHETPEFVNEGVFFVSAEAVQNGRINFDSKRGYITPGLHAQYIKKLHPQRNDIFMVKSGATTGKLAIVDVDFGFSVWSPLALIRADSTRITPQFLFSALHADYVQKQVQCTWSQGTQPNISMAAIEQLYVVAPPLPEQRSIAAYLDRETAHIDAAVAEAETLIAHLEEYRAALIAAAVTGKIQV